MTPELATGRFQNRPGNFGEHKNILDFLGIEPVFLSAPVSSVDIILTTVSGYKGLDNFFLNKFIFVPTPPGIYANGQLCVLRPSRFVHTPKHGLQEYCHSRRNAL